MHLIDLDSLKVKLSSGKFSARDAIPYLIADFILITAILVFADLNEAETFNGWDLVSEVISFILGIGGIFYAYKCNGGENGRDLIQKYIVLGLVVSVRVLLLFLPLMFLAMFLGEYSGILSDNTGAVDVATLAVFELFLYYRIGRNIRDTASPSL